MPAFGLKHPDFAHGIRTRDLVNSLDPRNGSSHGPVQNIPRGLHPCGRRGLLNQSGEPKIGLNHIAFDKEMTEIGQILLGSP
jgi:hypothetical protein